MKAIKLLLSLLLFALVITGCKKEEKVAAVNPDLIPLKKKIVTGYITGKNNIEIYIQMQGKGSPTLVLPGGPGYSFDYLLSVLSDFDSSFQLIFVDPRGCGRSMGLRNPALYTLDEIVADLDSVRSQLNIPALNIIGHETGGMIAQKYAIKYPNRVNRMVLMSTVAQTADLNSWLDGMRNFLGRAVSATVKAYEKDSLIFNETLNPAYESMVLGKLLVPNYFSTLNTVPEGFALPERSWPVYFEMWGRRGFFEVSGNLADFDTRENLKTIKTSALVLSAQNDFISPFVTESLINSIPKAEGYTFENAGHYYFIEKRDEFYKVVHKFLTD